MVRSLILTIALAACSSEHGASPPATPPADDLVRLTLHADRERVAPGADVELAARLQIAPGWHVYWQNPGDAGLPTKAKFTAPVGFEVGDVRYPGPESFRSPGGIVTWGYAGETALFANVRAPAGTRAETPGGKVDRAAFSVSASWLACRENCVRGKAVATIELPANDSPVRAGAALDAIRARLPRPWAELGVQPAWAYADGEMRMDLALPGASSAEFFWIEDTSVRLLGQAVRNGDGRVVLQARFSTDQPAAPSLRGALRVDRDGKTTYYAVDVPWPC